METNWYTTEELAKLLKLDPSSLRRWRTAAPNQGPPYVRLSGSVVRYPADEVDRWLRARLVRPESHQDAA